MARLNRRQFLTTGTLGTAAWALEAHAGLAAAAWPAGKSRSLQKAVDPVATVCVACDAHCPLLAYRDHGRVVQVGPDPAAGANATLCARAYQQLEALYDPERLVQPLERVGARGEGRWQTISWETALARLRQALEAGPQRAWAELGRPDPLALRLLENLGVTQVAGGRSRRQVARDTAESALYGAPLADPELADVRTVLLVGSQPWDGGSSFAPLARSLARAAVDGAEVIACSTYQGATGSVARRWLPLRPGSEVELLRGLAQVLWQDGVQGGLPASVGDELALYTPERVAAATGLTPDQLVALARRFGARGPAVCLAAATSAAEAAAVAVAAALLNALAGSAGATPLRVAPLPSGLPPAPSRSRDDGVAAVLAGQAPIPLYLAYRSNPVYRAGAAGRDGFADPQRVGLLVTLDTHLTETAELADLVLPAATDLELWNLLDTPAGPRLQQPAGRAGPEAAWLRRHTTAPAALFDGQPNGPLGAARQLGDVLLAVVGDAEPQHGAAQVALDLAAGLENRADASTATAERAAPPPKVSGQLAVAPGPRSAAGGFALVVLEPAVLDPATSNSRWGREARRHNPVYINRAVATQRGLRRGDRVEIQIDEARISARVEPISGIHPEAVALAAEYGHTAGGTVATARSSAAAPGQLGPAPVALPWWHADGPGPRVGAAPGPRRVTLRRA